MVMRMKSRLVVADAMTTRPIVAPPDMTLHNVAVLMDMHGVGSVLVKEGKLLKGIITERDFVTRVCLEGYDPINTPVSHVMSTDLLTVAPSMDLFDALLLMKDANVRHIPVMENNNFVGFITAKDILKIQPDLFENFVDMFELREEKRKLQRTVQQTATFDEEFS